MPQKGTPSAWSGHPGLKAIACGGEGYKRTHKGFSWILGTTQKLHQSNHGIPTKLCPGSIQEVGGEVITVCRGGGAMIICDKKNIDLPYG